jgi:hypothetical protein
MTDEPHDAVKLLIARMESHPEEFRVGDAPFHDRWYDHVNSIQAFGSEADKAAISAGLREIRLGETHERVMDELLNGEDRRRKVFEEQEYERNLSKSLALTKQQMMQQAGQGLQNAYANTYYDYDLDKMVGVGTTAPSTKLDVSAGAYQMTPSRVSKMKRMILGGK